MPQYSMRVSRWPSRVVRSVSILTPYPSSRSGLLVTGRILGFPALSNPSFAKLFSMSRNESHVCASSRWSFDFPAYQIPHKCSWVCVHYIHRGAKFCWRLLFLRGDDRYCIIHRPKRSLVRYSRAVALVPLSMHVAETSDSLSSATQTRFRRSHDLVVLICLIANSPSLAGHLSTALFSLRDWSVELPQVDKWILRSRFHPQITSMHI